MSEYTNPEYEQNISMDDLSKVPSELQLAGMRMWFGERFENPASRTPYKETLEINFPDKMSGMVSSVLIRHDIVHRNGKTADNEEHLMAKKDVEDLIKTVENLAQYIDKQLRTKPWEDF